MIDESAVAQFRNAWRLAGAGTDKIEAVVLLYRKIDGSLEATLAPMTYQFERSEFRWNAAIFGVVHTHPNCDDSRPSHEDLRLAKRFNRSGFHDHVTRYVYVRPRERQDQSGAIRSGLARPLKVASQFGSCIEQLMDAIRQVP
jgi:hypothetical protein